MIALAKEVPWHALEEEGSICLGINRGFPNEPMDPLKEIAREPASFWGTHPFWLKLKGNHKGKSPKIEPAWFPFHSKLTRLGVGIWQRGLATHAPHFSTKLDNPLTKSKKQARNKETRRQDPRGEPTTSSASTSKVNTPRAAGAARRTSR